MKSDLSKKRLKSSHFGNMNYLGNTISNLVKLDGVVKPS